MTIENERMLNRCLGVVSLSDTPVSAGGLAESLLAIRRRCRRGGGDCPGRVHGKKGVRSGSKRGWRS